MATPGRDEGLDKLEAFIALLDAARDRIEEGAERLDEAAGELREGADDLARETHRLEEMLGGHTWESEATASDIAELAAEAADAARSTIVQSLTQTAALQALAAIVEASLELLLTAAAETLTEDQRREHELLARMMVQLREQEIALMREMREELAREQEHEREKADSLKAASIALAVVMITVAVVVAVIAVIASIWTGGSSLLLIAAVAAIVQVCVTMVQSVPALMEAISVLMRACGFSEAGEAIDGAAAAVAELLGQDWFKWTLFAITIVMVIISLGGGMANAAAVAAVVTAMAALLMIAMAVVENVARLLSALNPFD
jgi:hypothetical protein